MFTFTNGEERHAVCVALTDMIRPTPELWWLADSGPADTGYSGELKTTDLPADLLPAEMALLTFARGLWSSTSGRPVYLEGPADGFEFGELGRLDGPRLEMIGELLSAVAAAPPPGLPPDVAFNRPDLAAEEGGVETGDPEALNEWLSAWYSLHGPQSLKRGAEWPDRTGPGPFSREGAFDSVTRRWNVCHVLTDIIRPDGSLWSEDSDLAGFAGGLTCSESTLLSLARGLWDRPSLPRNDGVTVGQEIGGLGRLDAERLFIVGELFRSIGSGDDEVGRWIMKWKRPVVSWIQ